MNSWSVVQFLKDGTVEVVPSGWLAENDTFCYWPSLPQVQLTNAIKKCERVNTNWKMYKIRVFRNSTFDDYALARKKANAAGGTSDLQSEVEKQNTRKRKAREHYIDSDSDDSLIFILPAPPKLKTIESLVTVHTDDATKNGAVVGNGQSSREDYTVESDRSPQYSTSSNANIEDYLRTIIEQQHLLCGMVTDVLMRVEAIEKKLETKQETAQQNKCSIFEQNIAFPIHSEGELRKFEHYLDDADNFKNAVCELSKIGGNNSYNFVKRVLGTVIANKLAMEYSWLGKKGKKKFHLLKVAKLLIDAAELCNLSSSKKEVEVAIQAWLRRAPERKKTPATIM